MRQHPNGSADVWERFRTSGTNLTCGKSTCRCPPETSSNFISSESAGITRYFEFHDGAVSFEERQLVKILRTSARSIGGGEGFLFFIFFDWSSVLCFFSIFGSGLSSCQRSSHTFHSLYFNGGLPSLQYVCICFFFSRTRVSACLIPVRSVRGGIVDEILHGSHASLSISW